MDRKKSNYDWYRDSPVRYLGYANELGEAFREYIGSKWVRVTYGIATAYMFADTADKTVATYKESRDDAKGDMKTVYTATDTFLWQLLASVAIPGFTINRLCAGTKYALCKTHLKKSPRNMLVTGVGIVAIPFIVHPIDHFVDVLLDSTLRKMRP